LELETNEFVNSNQILKQRIFKIQNKIFQTSFQNPISSRFGFWGKNFVLCSVRTRGRRRGKSGHKGSWSGRKNGPREKDRWATGKKREMKEKGENERK
jgi:hypothetical protein